MLATPPAAPLVPLAPIHLSCELELQNHRQTVRIVVFPEKAKAVVTLPETGRVTTPAANLTPASIIIPDGEVTWKIYRPSLALNQTSIIYGLTSVEQGQCKEGDPG